MNDNILFDLFELIFNDSTFCKTANDICFAVIELVENTNNNFRGCNYETKKTTKKIF